MNEPVEAIRGKTGCHITLNRLLVFIDCVQRKYQDGHAKLGEWINIVIRRTIIFGELHMMALPLCSNWEQILSYIFRRHKGLGWETTVVGVWFCDDETTIYLKFPKRAKKCKWAILSHFISFFFSLFSFFSFFLSVLVQDRWWDQASPWGANKFLTYLQNLLT